MAGKALQMIANQGINASGAKANVLGVNFKENCPDTRNSQVFALIRAMQESGITASAADLRADASMAQDETGIRLKPVEELEPADMTLLAVPHQELCERGYEWIKSITRQPGVFIGLQTVFRAAASEDKTLSYWNL